jgi:hypothetical protein
VTATYPASIKSFSTKTDFIDTVLAEHVNTLQEEVNSIQTNLGTLIKTGSGWVGSFDQVTTNWNTLKDRLANIEYGLADVYNDYVSLSGGSTILSSGNDVVGITVKAKSSQTANIASFKNSSDSVVTYVNSTGHIFTRAKELVPVIYSNTQPTGSSFAAGTLWIDSSTDVDTTVTTSSSAGSLNDTLMLMGG